MISILFALFCGWLLGLVGLDTLFHNMVGFNDTQYYLVWFFLGFFSWMINLLKK